MARQPNILFLMPDQLRWDFLSCYGADFIDTPNIDLIANEGVRYARAYSTSPICVPARASLLTGLNAIRNGVTDNGQWLRPDLAACGIRTWPEQLNAQGYYTAAIGKMHFYPWDINHGFQYRAICEDKRWLHVRDDYYHFLHERGHRKYHGNEHAGYFENRGAIISRLPWELSWDHFVGQEAVRFLRTYGDNADDAPFAMMVGFPGPHCPYDPSQEFLDLIDPTAMPTAAPNAGHTPKLNQQNVEGNKRPWNGVDYTEFTDEHKRKIRAHYAALVKQIDHEVGEILATLEAIGQLDNTIIIFASDHGDYLGDHDLIGKGSFYEASIHVPLLVRFPDGSQTGVHEGLVTLGDVTATILALAGCPLPDYLDSRPLPAIGLETTAREQIFGMVSNGWMVQNERWRLAKYSAGEAVLFDLQSDPDEQHNLIDSAEHQTVRQQLETALTQEIMRSLALAHEEKRVYRSDLSQDIGYGREGWQRPYPQPIGTAP
ncbi:MAG: sulfatase-like hydrolase/transferase [Caldilineaceae bacterium]